MKKLALLFAILGLMCGCGGGGGGGTPTPPTISVSLAPAGQTTIDQGQTVNFTATVANDSGSKGVTWSVSGTGCTGDACGTLTNTTTTAATYNAPASVSSDLTVSVKATSVADTTKSASSTVVVKPAPSITTTSLPDGTVDTAYSATLQASGGAGTLTWSITAGTLPGVLFLNSSTGAIFGTPISPATSTFTVQVTDSGSPPLSAQKQLSITINPAALTVTTTSLSNGVVGTAYSATLQSSGGTGAITWSVTVGTLPVGLSLNASTGVIAGTPTAAATSTFTVTATDSATPTPQTATKSLSITVNPALAVTTTSLADGMVGTAYSQTLAASGGTSPYTWSVTVGTLPAGLNLNASTGAISGTPTAAGTSTFTVTATDSTTPTHQTASKQLSITISAAALSIATASLPDGTVDTAYSQTLAASGGTPPYTWSVTVGTLPAGLTLNTSTGAISGTPTAEGTSTFTVTATDSTTPTHQTASRQLSITIAPAEACGSGSESALNGQYAFTLSGGNADYFLVVAGSFTADGAGGITAGEADSNGALGVQHANLNTSGSSYSVGSDHRGCATIATSFGTFTTRFALDAGAPATKGRIIEWETGSSAYIATGQIRKQDSTSFSAGLSGNYAFNGYGLDPNTYRIGVVGVLSASGGSFSNGEEDVNDGGIPAHFTGMNGSYSSINANGRGTTTVVIPSIPYTSHMAVYVVSGSEIAYVITDDPATNAVVSGEMRKQTGRPYSNASLSGKSVFYGTGASGASEAETYMGISDANGLNSVGITLYDNSSGTWMTPNPQTFTCNYSVAANGRTTLSGGTGDTCTGAPVFYLRDTNTAFLLGTGSSITDVGGLEPQAAGPFNNASLSGNYFMGTGTVVSQSVEVGVGSVTLDGAGNVSGTSDYTWTGGQDANSSFTDTYTVNADGTFTVGSMAPTIIGIVISGNKLVLIDASDSPDPSLLMIQK
jgi:hypothetical protein